MTKAAIQWNAKQLSKMFENQSIRFDNAIQRGEVWDNKRKSLFIDSMLRNYPVPPMFTIKTDERFRDNRGREIAVYDCIDGKQRSTAINQFRNNKFALTGLEPIPVGDEEVELNGLTYDELPEDLRDEFDSYSFTVYYFTEITDEEVTEMMDRLNNGKPLSGVEKARIKAADLDGIMELANHELFKEYLTEAAIKGYANEDIVIKNFIQYNSPEDPSFDAKRTKEIYASHVFSDDEKARFKGIFDKIWETISFIENDAPKKIYRKVIKKTNMLAILSLAEIDISSEDLAIKVTAFFTTEDNTLSINEKYNDAAKNGANHTANVKARNNAIRNYILDIAD